MLSSASGFLCILWHHLLILPQFWNSLCQLQTGLLSVKAAEMLLVWGLNAVKTSLGFVVFVLGKNNKIPCASRTLPYLPAFKIFSRPNRFFHFHCYRSGRPQKVTDMSSPSWITRSLPNWPFHFCLRVSVFWARKPGEHLTWGSDPVTSPPRSEATPRSPRRPLLPRTPGPFRREDSRAVGEGLASSWRLSASRPRGPEASPPRLPRPWTVPVAA